LALFLFAAIPLQQASAQQNYTEKLNVYVAGSSALWYMTFGGINGSSKLTGLENVHGLSWYNVTAIKTSGWQPDFQIFGPRGYNLLPVPFTPSEGLFLAVGSDNFTDASKAAKALGSYLLTNFISSSNGTGTYSFYSPLSFGDILPKTLLTFVPSKEGGFAKAISSTSFSSTSSPIVVLEGRATTSGFVHSLVLGSITSKGLDTSNRPSILGYFGASIASLQASNHSTSSTIHVSLLDGVVASHDSAARVTNSTAEFSGSYDLNVRLLPAKRVLRLNATVLEQPIQLLASRSVDTGVLRTRGNMSVTITMTDLSSTIPISKLSFTDSWWKSTGVFKLVSNTTFPTSIAPGSTVTPVYVLQYTGSTTGRMTIPASVIRYSFTVGGSNFEGRAVLNPVPLSLGADDAVVLAYLTVPGGFGKSVGYSQNITVVAKNVGTLPASSVMIAGKPVAGLADHGGTQSVQVTQSAQGFLGVNQTRTYSVTYKNPNGVSYNSTTNLAEDIFSHTSMKVGFPNFYVTENLVPLDKGVVNVTLSYIVTNGGLANLTSFLARGPLPQGLGTCLAKGSGIKCSGGHVSLNYTSIQPGATERAYLRFNVTIPQSYILAPLAFHALTYGVNLTGKSNAVGAPTGLVMTKGYSPSQLFGGMTSKVSVVATNAGSLTVFNATISSSGDSFDLLTSSSVTSKKAGEIAPGGNVSFSYGVVASSTSGSLQSTNVIANFYFGGSLFLTHAPGPTVTIYKPLSVTISTSPSSPIEGKSFTIQLSITNPSGVDVSDLLFRLPIPSGLSLTQLQNANLAGGSLTVSSSTLAAHATVNASAVGVASSGITVPFGKATLTFSYAGSTVSGRIPTQGIAIGEDVTTRYLVPTGLVLLALLATALYVRRKALPSAQASPK
jgi:hypothetical protein